MKSSLKVILIILGFLFVGLAILGIVLPLVPATPFLLLASACFVRSSDKLYNKLISNKYFGPYISNFRDGKGMPLRVKYYTIGILWFSLIMSFLSFDHLLIRISLVITGIAVSIFIYKIKTLEIKSQDIEL